jgi:hypothetical protein
MKGLCGGWLFIARAVDRSHTFYARCNERTFLTDRTDENREFSSCQVSRLKCGRTVSRACTVHVKPGRDDEALVRVTRLTTSSEDLATVKLATSSMLGSPVQT